MNNAKNRTPVCKHGVSLLLDAGHSCFECEKEALGAGLPIGLPIGMRIVDGTNAMLLHSHLQQAELAKGNGASHTTDPDPLRIHGTPWTGESLQRLINDLRAPKDINGDPLPTATPTCQHAGEADALAAELKALQRAYLAMRAELSEVTADRDTFAQENMELNARLDAAIAGLKRIGELATRGTKLG